MATISQLDANRQNARKSTGPRSAEGKAASSQNALKTGIDAQSLIIRDESLTDLEALTALYHDRFQPVTPEEYVLVDSLISADWLLRRLRKIEPQIWEKDFQRCERYDEYKKDFPLGDGVSRIDQTLSRLQRRLDATERSYHRALKAMQLLRPDCFEPTTTPPAEPIQPATLLPQTEIGFVPHSPFPVPDSPDPGPALEPRRSTAPCQSKYPPLICRLAAKIPRKNVPHKIILLKMGFPDPAISATLLLFASETNGLSGEFLRGSPFVLPTLAL